MTKFQKSYIIVTNPEDLGDLFCWPDFCHFWSDNYRWECSNPAFPRILPITIARGDKERSSGDGVFTCHVERIWGIPWKDYSLRLLGDG